jgi:hypothetical protein
MLMMKARGDDPVVQLYKYLYGEGPAGDRWDEFLEGVLTRQGWYRIAQNVAGSVYKRSSSFLAVYVDDGKMTGYQIQVIPFLFEIENEFPLSDKGWLKSMCGIAFVRLAIRGARMLKLSQREYTLLLLDRFTTENGGPARRTDTPFAKVDPQLDEEPGVFASTCRRHLGGLLFLVKCTRADAMVAVHQLCREVNNWTKGSDARLRKIFGYLLSTQEFCLIYRVKESETAETLSRIGFNDSDHGGDQVTMRSTSGFAIGPGTEDMDSFCLTDWGSRRQGATHRGSCGAETAGCDDCMLRSALPALEFWDALRGLDAEDEDAETPVIQFMDADSAKIVITGQKAAQLAYLKKHTKIDLSVLRDIFAPFRRQLRRKPTKLNPADMMTKGMKDTGDFIKHRTELGIVDGTGYDKYAIDLGPFPESSSSSSWMQRAASAVIPAGAAFVRTAVTHVAEDQESRGRVTRWLLKKAIG